MATVLRPRVQAPLLAFLYPPRCLAALHRPFSTTWAPLARAPVGKMRSDERIEHRFLQESDKLNPFVTESPKMAQKGITDQDLRARDFGLLPDTFIMPTGRNKPSITQWPRARLRLEWARAYRRLQDYFYVMAGKWAIIKPRPKLRTGQVSSIAQALQTRMYTAFAEGDRTTLYEVCCDGLARTFVHRLSRRPRDENWNWRLTRYRGRPRVVSHKIAAVPTGEKSQFIAIRQAVVRIRSEQTLDKGSGQAEPRDITEYLVLQEIAGPGASLTGQWKVWGTMEEDKDLWKKYI